MKIIAYYLPQFHEIGENNQWWGKGFTEWTNVKKAKPLYPTHKQPVVPLGHRYYNVLDKSTVEWQTKLMHHYGVYGFCYYHYWFEGDMLLEKPVKNLLEWKDINQKFCFCWANHDWMKKNKDKKLRKILKKQTYGNQLEWESHIAYLMEYFKDDRYIKINNKPVFVIYLPQNVPELERRLAYYDKICKENGFAGIYLVESVHGVKKSGVVKCSDLASAVTLREPTVALGERNFFQKANHIYKSRVSGAKLNEPMIYQYEKITKQSIQLLNRSQCEKQIFPGVFTGWDSTPRHGLNGFVIENNHSKLFEFYLREIKEYLNKQREPYVFLNAWNEWAEGMYLEPDEKKEFQMLEVIQAVLRE